MWKLASTGIALLVAGAAKLAEHVNRAPTLEDYLAFRCGPGGTALDAGAAGHLLMAGVHCWGCPAMVIGAGFVAFALVRSRRPATFPPARLRQS